MYTQLSMHVNRRYTDCFSLRQVLFRRSGFETGTRPWQEVVDRTQVFEIIVIIQVSNTSFQFAGTRDFEHLRSVENFLPGALPFRDHRASFQPACGP